MRVGLTCSGNVMARLSSILKDVTHKFLLRRKEGRDTSLHKHTMSTTKNSKETGQPPQLKKGLADHVPARSYLSPHPSPLLSQSVHGEKKALLL